MKWLYDKCHNIYLFVRIIQILFWTLLKNYKKIDKILSEDKELNKSL